ncbi:MAG: hypothetical protein AB8G99_11035 [Planctomycetaceae bacterium]
MLRELVDICRTVVRGDRIRVSPSEGRLLRLQPSCVLMIGSETIRIKSRTVEDSLKHPTVTYECETDFASGILFVQLLPHHRIDVEWRIENAHQKIAESDVIVLG